MKKLLVTVIALSTCLSAYAGGLLTNTNQSVHFLRNPARDASMEIDAVYTNPAGLAFMNGEGYFFSLNNQSAFQKRTITSEFAPFAGYGGDAEKKFEGETKAWVIPNLQFAYKKGDWVVSANIGAVGGGGTVDFSKGLPSFESTVSVIPLLLNGLTQSTNFGGYALESQLKGSSIIYGAQVGASYAANEHFSVYGGLRYNYVNNGYEGYLKNIQIGMGGNLVPAAVLLENPNMAPLTPLLSEKQLDCKQTGSGIAPIVGWDFNWKNLNVGVKYEFKTRIELKNKTDIDETGLFPDGEKTDYDIPALLAVGAQYAIIPSVKVSAGYHHFFDSDAKMANGKQEYINGGINEYLLGAEWQINKMFLVSAGGQITRTGVKDEYQSDMSFSLHSYSVGLGGAINVTKNIRVNLAYFFTNYSDWTKKSADYGNVNALTQGLFPATAGTDTFSRTNNVFGIGLDFRF